MKQFKCNVVGANWGCGSHHSLVCLLLLVFNTFLCPLVSSVFFSNDDNLKMFPFQSCLNSQKS
jgi:hypothetical protein